eukprot:4193727-Alexandrium_andersonii.AAC.1
MPARSSRTTTTWAPRTSSTLWTSSTSSPATTPARSTTGTMASSSRGTAWWATSPTGALRRTASCPTAGSSGPRRTS